MALRHALFVRTAVLAGMIVAACALAGTPAALADTATVTVTDAAGNSDPAASLGRVFTFSGATAAPEYLFVKWRATGGAPCAPSALVDTGAKFQTGGQLDFEYGVHDANGNFSYPHAITWSTPGTFLFCMWFAQTDSDVATPISQVITFRSPTGSIGATLAPPTPVPNQSATITISGASEASEDAYAAYNKAGVPCAASAAANSGSLFNADDDGIAVNGAFSLPLTESFVAGSYLLCLWLADSPSTTTPIAAQTIPFTVAAPEPPRPPRTKPLRTHVRSTFPKVAHKLKMTVSSQVTATGQTPQGSCWLQVYANHHWRTAGAHTRVTATGTCQIATRFSFAGGKRFRVSFRPAAGFKQAFGASAWVIAAKH